MIDTLVVCVISFCDEWQVTKQNQLQWKEETSDLYQIVVLKVGFRHFLVHFIMNLIISASSDDIFWLSQRKYCAHYYWIQINGEQENIFRKTF